MASSTSATIAANAADRSEGHADGSVELRRRPVRAHLREVGEDRRLDRLEELERRAGDQEDVEGEARERRALGAALGGVHDQRPGVEERLLAEHHEQHGRGEAGPVRERELRPRRIAPPRAGLANGAPARRANGTTVRLAIGAASMPNATAS